MDVFVEVTPKLEGGTESLLTCKLCLGPQSSARLTRRDLTSFYCVFRACGLGLNIMEPAHYNWVCQYCWVRASQCLKFIECARKAEHVLSNVFRHEEVTEEKLRLFCGNDISRPVELSSRTVLGFDMPSDRFTDTDGEFTTISTVPPIGRADAPPVDDECYDETEHEDLLLKTESLADAVRCRAEDSSEKRERRRRKVKRKGGECKEQKVKQPRKDPAELLAKWRELEVEVINLTPAEQLAELESRRGTQRYLSWRYKCDRCAIGFHELESIEKHKLVHDEARGSYACDVCQVRFAQAHQLSSHMGGHRRRWRCLRCGDTISKSAYLAPHHAACTDTAPVACHLCGKFYPNNLRLRKHVSKSHNAKHKYMCDVCGRAFKEKQQIKYHMRTHTRERPFQCALCGKRSSTSTGHRIHMTVHKKETKNPETYCVECNKYFKNKYILRIHFKQSLKHVSKDTFPHACTECDERFPGTGALRVHMNTIHLNNRTYACSLCDKAYYTRGALTAHAREKHTYGERTRDYLCAVCNKAFVTSSQLKAHSRIHTKERPYVCLLCPATFSFNSALYTHTKLKHKMTPAQVKHKLGIRNTST